MYHDLLDKQPQQFRRQLRNVSVPLRLVKETIRPTYRFPQALDIRFFLRDICGDPILLLRIAADSFSYLRISRWISADCLLPI